MDKNFTEQELDCIASALAEYGANHPEIGARVAELADKVVAAQSACASDM